MLSAFRKTFAQMSDPAFRRVLWISTGLTLLVFIGVLLLAHYVVLPLLTVFDYDWLNWLIQAAGIGVAVIALFVLFPGVATVFVSFFLDSVAEAVERKHYAQDPPGHEAPLLTALGSSLRLLVIIVLLNLLCLPIYIFLPGLNLFVFYALNGYLLSREYFELVSIRHMKPSAASALRRRAGPGVFLTGVLIAFLLTIPVVNLIAPVFATAMMVHVFKAAWHRHGTAITA